MNNPQLRPLLISGGLALISALMVFGSFAAALSEGGLQAPNEPTQTPLAKTTTATPLPDDEEGNQGAGDPDKGSKPEEGTATKAANPTTKANTPTPKPTNTPRANNSDSDPAPTNTPLPSSTPAPNCGPPAGWTSYVIQSGDTLFSLAQAFSTTVPQLQNANCLGGSTAIIAGQTLFVPNVATNTPNATATKTPKPTSAKKDTTTTITSALPDPSVVGEAVTVVFTVTGSGGTPTGNVTVTDGTNSCTASVAAGTCDIVFTSAGATTIHAKYNGDSDFKSSTSANESHTVDKADTTTTIDSALPDPSTTGNPVTVMFSVSVDAPGAGTPTGTVTISSDNDAATCMASVAVGQCDITLTTVGAHNLTADYAGSSNFETSTSGAEGHTVN